MEGVKVSASEKQSDWPDQIQMLIWIKREGDGTFGAIVEEFSIAGQGGSPREAAENAADLARSYLQSYVEDGESFEAAVRPISSWQRRKFRAELLWSRLIRRLRAPRVERRIDRETLRPAHC